jgi:hypothetical protein
MTSIEQLLHRRTDLSTFLVHLTRDSPTATARANLLSIAAQLKIEARTPLGPAAHLEPHLAGTTATQKVVCFTETPLEHAWMMIEDIDGRAVRFAPYGIVFTKTTARLDHCNPVWYTDISTRGGRSWPMTAVNDLVKEAVEDSSTNEVIDEEALVRSSILSVTPFIEQMGPTRVGRKEFWWEREWRHVDDYHFSFPSRVVAFLAPEADHERFAQDLTASNDVWEMTTRPLLDPSWGLERMLVSLAGIHPDHMGPFPTS